MGPGLIPKPVAIVIAVMITAVWGASQLGSLFVPGYQAPDSIHAALMIVLGAVFALQRKGDDKPGDDKPAVEDVAEPAKPPAGVELAADLIARLQAEQRERGGRG